MTIEKIITWAGRFRRNLPLKIVPIVLATVASGATAERSVPTSWSYAHALWKPVNMLAVRPGGIWKSRIDTNIAKGWFDVGHKLEENGHITPFRTIAEGRDVSTGAKTANNDEFVYKWMEAGGYYAGYPSGGSACERVRAELDKAVDLVLRIQKPDGYINSFFGNRSVAARLRPPFDSENRFEFYNFGHLAQAAIARYRTTGDRKFLDGAIRFADLIVARFAAPNHLPYRMNRGPIHTRTEHPNHEPAMVELYRVTGDRRYLDFVRQTLEEYNFCSRWQIDGHAVQETLLNCGAVDVFLETGDKSFLDASTRLWADMVKGRMYLTGGIGSKLQSEAFGDKYELPNEAYAETCAAISSFFWSHRLLLATGEGMYGDLMERLMYNGILSGLSLSGTEYFYTNPLVAGKVYSDEKARPLRKPWFSTPCCPPNVARFLASLGGYFYATAPDGISALLYGASAAEIPFGGRKISITQRTNYPWDGTIKLAMEPERPAEFTLRLRIPSWTEGRPVPFDLYRYINAEPARFQVLVNGTPTAAKVENGFAALRREWRHGDIVELRLPMPVRKVAAHESILNLRNHAALERGPVVYCVEGIDHGGSIRDLKLPDGADLRAEFMPGLLGGVTVLRGGKLTAIPYAVWANRGVGDMAVWLPFSQ